MGAVKGNLIFLEGFFRIGKGQLDGSVAGVEDTEAEMEKIGNMIRDGIKPDLTAYTSIERIEPDSQTGPCQRQSRRSP